MKAEKCPNRFPARTTAPDGTPSHRRIFLCKKKSGFLLKHWKCTRCVERAKA